MINKYEQLIQWINYTKYLTNKSLTGYMIYLDTYKVNNLKRK